MAVTVSKKGGVIIPKGVRNGITSISGDMVEFVDLVESVTLVRLPEDPLAAPHGYPQGR